MRTSKINMLVLVLFVSLALLSGCAGQGDTAQVVADITPAAAYALINENQGDEDFVILDVRTAEEYAEGHIDGAINLDFYSDTFQDELEELDRDKTYLVYCRTDHRSGIATNVMENLGFAEVYNLDGGIVEWETLGLPTIR